MTCAETKDAVEPLPSTSSGSKVEQLSSCEHSDGNMNQDQHAHLKRPFRDMAFSHIPVIPAVEKKRKRWRRAKKKKEKKEGVVDVKLSEQYFVPPNHRF